MKLPENLNELRNLFYGKGEPKVRELEWEVKNLREALREKKLLKEDYVFTKSAEGWLIIFDGFSMIFKADKGFEFLHYCLRKFPEAIANKELDALYGSMPVNRKGSY